MNDHCPNCDALLQHNASRRNGTRLVRASWQCANCGQAGGYARVHVGNRTVTVRDVVTQGDPALHKPWVPAESVPYAERVS